MEVRMQRLESRQSVFSKLAVIEIKQEARSILANEDVTGADIAVENTGRKRE
jgi:hypothetical protein